MTIAIGMACHGGIVVAADTQIAVGTVAQKASKLYIFKARSGPFAIAFASDDANATRTLLNRITRKLAVHDCAHSTALEKVICEEMTEWRSAYTISPPAMQFILACRLNNECPRLFFCEPPNTFLEHEGYVAVGAGADITDSLHSTLFKAGMPPEVQSALRQLSYLMYRAKEENIYCGKATYCAIVSWNCDLPLIVNHLDLERAEKLGTELDFLLRSLATLYLTGSDAELQNQAQGIASMFQSAVSFRKAEFHGLDGKVITF